MAIAGNHDGMVAPGSSAGTLDAFRNNFCASGQDLHTTPEAGGLVRTAQIQPGVYFTLEAPFVRILGLYSNALEDPGIISSQGGTYKNLTDVQLTFLSAALTRIRKQKFAGAVIIAVHHPPYVATTKADEAKGVHGGSPDMLAEIDAICAKTGIWPHAVLSGHAHNYQRFIRTFDGRQTPFVVCGNGGHAVSTLTRKSTPPLRTPADQPLLSNGSDSVSFQRYDDQDFGYLRVVVSETQLRIEYHPASDGAAAKTPDDSMTVDLKTHTLVPGSLKSPGTRAVRARFSLAKRRSAWTRAVRRVSRSRSARMPGRATLVAPACLPPKPKAASTSSFAEPTAQTQRTINAASATSLFNRFIGDCPRCHDRRHPLQRAGKTGQAEHGFLPSGPHRVNRDRVPAA